MNRVIFDKLWGESRVIKGHKLTVEMESLAAAEVCASTSAIVERRPQARLWRPYTTAAPSRWRGLLILRC